MIALIEELPDAVVGFEPTHAPSTASPSSPTPTASVDL
jgi:hypothetical protein